MGLQKLRTFVEDVTAIVSQEHQEAALVERVRPCLSTLIAADDWLPPQFTIPHPTWYQQYLLHCDPQQRFSVVSFVWGPGQQTPIHDHTVWGLIGMLRGAEIGTRYAAGEPGSPMRVGEAERLEPGAIDVVSPAVGDVHVVRNAYVDRVSISIHVYGANIGSVKRHVFDGATGSVKEFVSGFSSPVIPNIWQ
jgi:predicted metal-dependent enzyme (double-stranded beta helix superfamily)